MPKDNHPPYFPLYVDDFISDSAVDAMTNEELGIYTRLLCKAWKEEPAGTIPDDDRILSNWAKTTASRWKHCREGVLRAFILRGGRLHQKRMILEWSKLMAKMATLSEAGKRGAEKRWGSDSQANGHPNATELRTQWQSGSGSGSESDSSRTEDRTGETERPDGSKNSASERQETGPPIDLSAVDWGEAESVAAKIGKLVPIRQKPRERVNDRRQWLRYAVLAQTAFPPAWLMDAADKAARSPAPKQSRRGIFVACLKSTSDMTPRDFNELTRRIEIPDGVWASPVLGGPVQ